MTEVPLSSLDPGYDQDMRQACESYIVLCTAPHPQLEITRMREVFEMIFPPSDRVQARAVIAEILSGPREEAGLWAPQKYVP